MLGTVGRELISVVGKIYYDMIYYIDVRGVLYNNLIHRRSLNEISTFRYHIFNHSSTGQFLYLLNNDCNVSIQKCRNFFSELTDGKLNISTGMINKLSKELAAKSETERKKLLYFKL